MDSPLFFNEIEIGAIWISPRRTITEADVIQFASMTGDFNPLHVDYEFASKSHYRQPIAHGLLGLSWVAGLGSFFPSVTTLAFTAVRNWEFNRPLYFGDTVYVETRCLEKEPSGRRAGKVAWERKLINQSDQVVQQGVFETLVAIKETIPESKMAQSHFPGVRSPQAYRVDEGGENGREGGNASGTHFNPKVNNR